MSNEVNIVVKSQDKTGPGTKSARKNIDDVGESTKRVGDVAKGVLAAGVFDQLGDAAARGFQSTYTAAKDLGESVNAVGKIFGDQATEVIDWGKQNAAAFGLSQRAFNQSVVPMGAVLKNTGLDMDTVSDRTLMLTQRAADMASVFNVDVDEALAAIQSGLKGEADPLEAFGVGLSAAAVEAEAMANRTAGATGELTEQEKMLARVNLIMKQTSDTQGDFADTSDDAANAQRRSAAELENAQAVIGQSFLPVMAGLASATATVAGLFSELPGPIQTVVGSVGVLGAGALVLAPRLIAVKAALEGMGVTMPDVGGKMRSVGKAATVAGASIAALSLGGEALNAIFGEDIVVNMEALVLGLERWAEQNKLSGEAARFLGDNAQNLSGDLEQLASWANFAAGPAQGFIETISSWEGSITRAEKHLGTLGEALAELVEQGEADTAAAAFAKIAEQANAMGVSTDELRELMPAYSAAQEVAAAKTKDTGDAMAGTAESTDSATASLDEYMATLKAATDPVFALIDALDGVESAQAAYNEAVAEHGPRSAEARNAAIDLARAVSGAEAAALNGELSFDDFKNKLREWVRQGAITAGQAKAIENRVKDARNAANDYKGNYDAHLRAKVDRNSIDNANNALNNAARDRTAIIRAHAIAGSNPSIGALMKETGGIVGAVPHAAEGGPRGGSTVLVGERGAELAELPFGTRVVPAGQTAAMMGGGGGGPVVIEIRSGGSKLDDLLVEILRRSIRDKGGDVQAVLGQ